LGKNNNKNKQTNTDKLMNNKIRTTIKKALVRRRHTQEFELADIRALAHTAIRLWRRRQ
jgi:hypothetical protein